MPNDYQMSGRSGYLQTEFALEWTKFRQTKNPIENEVLTFLRISIL
jgi:hypothetical protein